MKNTDIRIITPMDKEYKQIKNESIRIFKSLDHNIAPLLTYNALLVILKALEEVLEIKGEVNIINEKKKERPRT